MLFTVGWIFVTAGPHVCLFTPKNSFQNFTMLNHAVFIVQATCLLSFSMPVWFLLSLLLPKTPLP